MNNRDKIREYFEKEHADFDASYSNPQKLKDIVRRLAYWYSKKPIEGRLTALLDLKMETASLYCPFPQINTELPVGIPWFLCLVGKSTKGF